MTHDEQGDDMLRMVAEFQTKFEMKDDAELWANLVIEEGIERINAEDESAEQRLKESADFLYVMAGLDNIFERMGDVEEFRACTPYEALIIDEAMDLIEWGEFEPEVLYQAFKRVHESNMSKLDENGKPIRREDGKILKGPNYAPPVLADLVETN